MTPFLFFVLAACGSPSPDHSDDGADSDADTDSDTDSGTGTGTGTDGDADTDSDTDSDTDTGSASDPCAPADADGDGHDRIACGGDDCDDAVATIHPGAPDGPAEIDTVEVDTPSARPAIAIDTDGMPWVAFQDANDVGQYDLRMGNLEVDGWDVDTYVRDRNVGTWIPVAAGPVGSIHLAYGAGTLMYATNASGAWVHESIDDALGGDAIDLAVDDAGAAHVTLVQDFDVIYLTNVTGEWTRTPIDTDGYVSGRASIAIGPDGEVHVVSWNGDLRHATNASGEWTAETIDPGTGYMPDVAIDADGVAHVVYSESGTFHLAYATDATGVWTFEPVDDVQAYDESIVLTPDGTAHVAYSVLGDEDVRYATNALGDWTVEVVDDEGWTGRMPSIATDGTVIRIAYLDVALREVDHAVLAPIDGIDQDCDGEER